MTSNKFIESITNKVYNQIRQSSSDAEARRYLKEHQAKQLTLTDVVKSFVCDFEKGTRCKDSFPNYKDGKCRICGGQAN